MKVLISFDERLLKRIDQKAKSRGLTRSDYLAQLAQDDVARSEVIDATLERLDRLFANAPVYDATAAVRAGRDSAY